MILVSDMPTTTLEFLMSRMCRIVLGLLLTAGIPTIVSAQEQVGGSSTTNYHFAEPNELTIIVNVLGGVQRPGRYEISRTIDLMNLLSLAGGVVENGDLDKVRVTRTVKTATRVERKEITIDLSDLTRVSEAELLLNPGDYVFVPQSRPILFQDVLTYVTTIALLTISVISVVNSSNN